MISNSVVCNIADFAGIKKTSTAHKHGISFKSTQSTISDLYIDETGRYLTIAHTVKHDTLFYA